MHKMQPEKLCVCNPNLSHPLPEVCSVDCGTHGVCMGGACRCEEGWTGAGCDQRVCNPLCIKHGTCKDGKCQCHQGWNGEHCTIGRCFLYLLTPRVCVCFCFVFCFLGGLFWSVPTPWVNTENIQSDWSGSFLIIIFFSFHFVRGIWKWEVEAQAKATGNSRRRLM